MTGTLKPVLRLGPWRSSFSVTVTTQTDFKFLCDSKPISSGLGSHPAVNTTGTDPGRPPLAPLIPSQAAVGPGVPQPVDLAVLSDKVFGSSTSLVHWHGTLSILAAVLLLQLKETFGLKKLIKTNLQEIANDNNNKFT